VWFESREKVRGWRCTRVSAIGHCVRQVVHLDHLSLPADPWRRVCGRRYTAPVELLALLFAVGVVVKFWFIIGAIIGPVVGAHSIRLAMDSHFARVEAERRRAAGLVAQADRQHDWVMQGDLRGTYSEYPPLPV
jgi:hypothetical protein